jgi:hypothetical protein
VQSHSPKVPRCARCLHPPFHRIPESFTLLQHDDHVAGRQEDAIRAGRGESECLWIVQIYMDGISTLFPIILLALQAVNTTAGECLVIGRGFELPDCGSGQGPELLASDRTLPCLRLILKGIVIRWIVSKALEIKEQEKRVDTFLMDCFCFNTPALNHCDNAYVAVGYWVAVHEGVANAKSKLRDGEVMARSLRLGTAPLSAVSRGRSTT